MGWVTRSIFVLFIALFVYSTQADDITTTPAEDFSFCHTIDFKHLVDNCTDGAKYPILGNCTSYYKCDGMSNGAILHETDTFCPEGQFFDRKKLNCVEAKSEDLESCDQKTCETVFQAAGVEKIQEKDAADKEKYTNEGPSSQGQGQRPGANIYPKTQQPSQQHPTTSQGHQGQHNQGEGHGGQYENPTDQGPSQKPYPGGKPNKDQDNPNEGKKEQNDKGKDSKKNQSSFTSASVCFILVSALVTCSFTY